MQLFRSFYDKSGSHSGSMVLKPDFEGGLRTNKTTNRDNERSLELSGRSSPSKRTKLFWQEKARREQLFRDKHAANFNITG